MQCPILFCCIVFYFIILYTRALHYHISLNCNAHYFVLFQLRFVHIFIFIILFYFWVYCFIFLQAALLQTKNIKQESPVRERSQEPHTSEDARWIRKVIDEEQVKPLEVRRKLNFRIFLLLVVHLLFFTYCFFFFTLTVLRILIFNFTFIVFFFMSLYSIHLFSFFILYCFFRSQETM